MRGKPDPASGEPMVISSNASLRDLLHKTGEIFYQEGLFCDAIILDQQWALDAVYTVFDRTGGLRSNFAMLQRRGGRFTREELAELVWARADKPKRARFSENEQKLFLSFMQQCGMCFQYREDDDRYGVPGAYIAPDLLPGRDAPDIAAALNLAWPQDAITASAGTTVTREYALLSDTLLRALMVGIGQEAGLSAIYWNRGVAAREATTGARLLVERGDLTAADGSTDSTDDWAGTLTLRTLDGDAPALLAKMLARLDELEKHYGVIHETQTPEIVPERPDREVGEAAGALSFPATKRWREPEGIFVSYRHGVGKEYIDKLCAAASARDIPLQRDSKTMQLGDRISAFSERLRRGERVIFFMSPEFMDSFYCMYELTGLWKDCRDDAEEFLERARFFRLPAKKKSGFRLPQLLPGQRGLPEKFAIKEVRDRQVYVKHWQRKVSELSVFSATDIAPTDHLELGVARDSVHLINVILGHMQDQLKTYDIDEFIDYALDGLEK